MNQATKAINFLETLGIPEGPKAGKPLKLASFQKRFIRGTFKKTIQTGVLSVARGNGKSAITGGLALAELLGVFNDQPRREIICAARTQQQARIIWQFVQGLCEYLPEDIQSDLVFRRSPYAEIAYQGENVIHCVSASPKNVLGTAPTMAIMDERGHWEADRGDDLEAALMSGLGKRGGKCIIISTSAPDDTNSLSKWLDDPPEGTYVQEHRPKPGLPADDMPSLLEANPGAKAGIGSSPKWLKAQAQRAISRGGSALQSFRLYNRNERVSGEARDVLLTTDQWLACEVDKLPPRQGPVVAGIDLGGSSSMSAAALYWYETGRLETFGAFPTVPTLANRGDSDGVRGRYVDMQRRGELITMGGKVVPTGDFLKAILTRLDGERPCCIVGDRYRQAEFAEAMQAAQVRWPVVFRGFGFRDGGEDCERFRQAAFDNHIKVKESLLLRSAFAEAVVLRDPANNMKIAKARSKGRIDAAVASVVAVAEGRRRAARGHTRRPVVWA